MCHLNTHQKLNHFYFGMKISIYFHFTIPSCHFSTKIHIISELSRNFQNYKDFSQQNCGRYRMPLTSVQQLTTNQ